MASLSSMADQEWVTGGVTAAIIGEGRAAVIEARQGAITLKMPPQRGHQKGLGGVCLAGVIGVARRLLSGGTWHRRGCAAPSGAADGW